MYCYIAHEQWWINPSYFGNKIQSELSAEERVINTVEFPNDSGLSKNIASSLVVSGWSIEHHAAPFTNI